MALNRVSSINDNVKIDNVLISVADKRNLDRLVVSLVEMNPDLTIFSTGGSYKTIQECLGEETSKRHLVSVSDYTGQPEMQGGLVKTLDFKIYLGLLSETYNAEHKADLVRTGAVPIDMVVVNLYPFKQTIALPECTPEDARTNIDIGGPCMIRAAAKNYLRTASVTDPSDYDNVISVMREGQGTLPLAFRFTLMQKAFSHTADYDAAIAAYFQGITLETVASCYQAL